MIILQKQHIHIVLKIIIVFIIAATLIFISQSIKVNFNSDDGFFINATNQWTLTGFLSFRYMTWTGRIAVEMLLFLTIKYHLFWKISIPLCLLLMSSSISRIVCQKIKIFNIFIVMLLFLLIPRSMSQNTVLWVTGFYFYLLPLSLAIYVLSFVISKSQNKYEYILSCFLLFVFSCIEQVGMFFLYMSCLSFIILKHTRTWKKYTIFLLSIINYVISITAPGNYNRIISEAQISFPDYLHYSFLQKIYCGFDKLFQFFIMINIPLFVFVGLIVLIYILQGLKTIAGTISLGISILFLCFSTLHIMHRFFWQSFNAESWIFLSTYTSYFFVVITIISMIILIASSIKVNTTLYLTLGLFFIGMVSIISVGLSPTIYASGIRIDYVSEICIVMMCMFIVDYLYQLKLTKI